MAEYTLQTLIDSLQNNTYTPPTEAEMQQTAQNRYQSYYDQQRLQAQQGHEQTNLALTQQLSSLNQAYGHQLQQSAENYRNAYSQADRQMLGRGMQRSSYGSQVLTGVQRAGAKAADEIMSNQALAVGNVEEQRTLLAQQLAAQLQQYSASQASDILAYIDELEAQGYDRQSAANQYNNSLAAQIYQFANQEQQQTQAQANWLAEFNESQRQFNQLHSGSNRNRTTGPGRTNYDITADENERAEAAYLTALLNNPSYNPTTGSNGYMGR